ncbi:hypothetical protein SAMN05216462_2777 [Xylanibacter ruminicola]|uniref:Uncharacterized protein n=1 Tax=Xylanibacter ruminicola TaxID=839 RepID=A0A1H4EEV7_XYLRU|nr:hypothetical protein SAMN05216462_2777 [Xylanibacter ruminicola]
MEKEMFRKAKPISYVSMSNNDCELNHAAKVWQIIR